MQCLDYPMRITRNWWPSVDTMLTVIFRMGLWPCHILHCVQWLPIRLLWITAHKSLTNYLIYKTKNLWGSIDAHFQDGEVNMSLALLLIKAANMLVTHNSKHIPFQLPYLHYQKALTLCWWSVQGGNDVDTNYIAHIGGQTSIMGKCHSTTLGLYKMQHPKSLTLCWHSVDAVLTLCWRCVDTVLTLCWHCVDTLLTLMFRCSNRDNNDIAYNGGQ